jgi:hypothetical protein
VGIAFAAFSCRSDKVKREAEAKTREFFSALRNDDKRKLTVLYPGLSKLDPYYKSDSVKIVPATEANGVVIVTVDNSFTNGFGKLSQEIIILCFKVDSAGTVILYDSKGLSDFNENDGRDPEISCLCSE